MKCSMILFMAAAALVAADAQAVNMSLHDGPMAATAASRISSTTGSGTETNGTNSGKGQGVNGDQGGSLTMYPGKPTLNTTSGSTAGNNTIGSTVPPKAKSNGNTVAGSIVGVLTASALWFMI